jgi:hypothetical protein
MFIDHKNISRDDDVLRRKKDLDPRKETETFTWSTKATMKKISQ